MTVHTRPLVPEDLGRRSGRRPDPLSRAAAVIVLSEMRGDSDIAASAKSMFPDDAALVHVVKAAVSPATTTSMPVLGQTVVSQFLVIFA